MTQEFVAEQLGIPRSAVSEVEGGKRELSATELFDLAKLFGESMEYLLGREEHRPEEELVMLRADAITPLTKAELRRFATRCHEYRQLEEWTGEGREPDLRRPHRIFARHEQAQGLADEERKRLDLGLAPAHQLFEVLEERVGIKILFMRLEDGISGASVNSPGFGPAILVNENHSPGRRLFTLAHEYFHLLTEGRVANSKGARTAHLCEARKPDEKKDRAEQLADQFAGQLLMPRQHFVEQLQRLVREDKTIGTLDLIGVARYFGVSVQAVFVRMAVLKIVPWDEAKKAYDDPALQDSIRQGGEQGPEPTRFKRLAVKAYLAEEISRSRLAELLDVTIVEVDGIVQRYGGEDARRGVKLALPR
jgi:Zn-dependent peptidase ImmA (M78 family)/DNA-binding XRE family transcriptional regulator